MTVTATMSDRIAALMRLRISLSKLERVLTEKSNEEDPEPQEDEVHDARKKKAQASVG